MKEEIENLKTSTVHQIFIFIYKTKSSYCLKFRKNTESKKTGVEKTKSRRIMFSLNFAACGSKNSRFTKEQEASGLLNKLELKTLLSKIPIVGSILF